MCVWVCKHIMNSPTGRTYSYITENENENYVPEKWHTPGESLDTYRREAVSTIANLIRIFADFVLIFHSSAPRTAFFPIVYRKNKFTFVFSTKARSWDLIWWWKLASLSRIGVSGRFIRFNYDYIIRTMSTREDINIMKKPNANSSKLLCNRAPYRAE